MAEIPLVSRMAILNLTYMMVFGLSTTAEANSSLVGASFWRSYLTGVESSLVSELINEAYRKAELTRPATNNLKTFRGQISWSEVTGEFKQL